LSEHLLWQQKRERIKINLRFDSQKKYYLDISLPEGLNQFSLELFGAGIRSGSADVDIENIGKGRYRLNSNNKFISVYLDAN
jgi:hypothetical protein